jgi:TrmH family RNA methyltransferase
MDAGVSLEYILTPKGAPLFESPSREAAAVPTYPVRAGLLDKLTGAGKGGEPIALAPLPPAPADDDLADVAVLCERVQDPGNLGTIVRTASALGVADVVLTDEETDPFSRRALSASRGATLTSRIHRFGSPVDAITSLRSQGFQIVATSPHGEHLQSLAPLTTDRVALVVGNETDGISGATLSAADLVVQIPMSSAVESLNVGVAAGIGLYEMRTRLILSTLTHRIRRTLGRDLNATATMARQALDRGLRDVSDMNAQQAILLMVLACDGEAKHDDLARDTGIGPQELGTAIGPLLDRGYLATDGHAIHMQREGERAVASLWAIQERVEDTLLRGFSREERTQLHDLLRRVRRHAVDTGEGAPGSATDTVATPREQVTPREQKP